MAHETTEKFIIIVIFITLMIIFFMWIVSQVSDLGLVFGFRTSHVIAHDVASLITSMSGVPGETTVSYVITPGTQRTGEAFDYKIKISDKMVCATSFLFSEDESTTDCASHSYELDKNYLCETEDGSLVFEIDKKIVGGSTNIELVGAGCKIIA